MTSSPSRRTDSTDTRQASVSRANQKTVVTSVDPVGESDTQPAVYASDLARSTGTATSATKGQAKSVTPTTSPIQLSPFDPEMPYEHRPQMVLKLAAEAFAQTGSWVVFYREIMGCDGVVWKLFPDAAQRRHFESTPEFAELLEIMTSIRSQDNSKTKEHEPERVITVRLPRSMHATAVEEAKELGLSINSYCLTKLLQPINKRFTPLEVGPRRGRRPGPQIQVEKTADGEITMQRIRVPAKQSDSPSKTSRKSRKS
ncbi:MAG: toxin-antitoxin system HicB family antitoxin [Rhodopirellula sp. JB055]|uniref:toxin-antitoxin system HicB family antitoxin n=1 Tax=Rhodopirellula sp. JB055 TaxID=3342846 RepID=UPI00370B022A